GPSSGYRRYEENLELEADAELELPRRPRRVRQEELAESGGRGVLVVELQEVRVRGSAEAAVERHRRRAVVLDRAAAELDVAPVEDVEGLGRQDEALAAPDAPLPLDAEVDLLERLVPEGVSLEGDSGGAEGPIHREAAARRGEVLLVAVGIEAHGRI